MAEPNHVGSHIRGPRVGGYRHAGFGQGQCLLAVISECNRDRTYGLAFASEGLRALARFTRCIMLGFGNEPKRVFEAHCERHPPGYCKPDVDLAPMSSAGNKRCQSSSVSRSPFFTRAMALVSIQVRACSVSPAAMACLTASVQSSFAAYQR